MSKNSRVIGVLRVLYAEASRELITWRCYAVESVSGLIMVYLLFLGFFFSSHGFTDPAAHPAVTAVDHAHRAVGFTLWLFALNAVGHFSNAIRDEANMGIIEQIALGPSGLVADMWGRAIGKTIIDTVTIGLVLGAIMLTTGISLKFPLVPVALTFLLTIAGLYGLAFFFGGLALIYKRIGSVTLIVRFSFLILTGAVTPLDDFPLWLQMLSKSLPMTLGLEILKQLMIDQKSLAAVIQNGDLALLAANSSVYLVMGIAGFKWLEGIARKKGVLGAY